MSSGFLNAPEGDCYPFPLGPLRQMMCCGCISTLVNPAHSTHSAVFLLILQTSMNSMDLGNSDRGISGRYYQGVLIRKMVRPSILRSEVKEHL